MRWRVRERPAAAWPAAAWPAALVISVLALAGIALAPRPWGNVLGCALGAALVITILWRIGRHELPLSGRLPWLLLASTTLLLSADVLAALSGPAGAGAFPTAIDALRLAGYLSFISLIAAASRLRSGRGDALSTLDGLIFASTLLLPVWFVYVAPAALAAGATGAQIAEAVVYGAVFVVGLGAGGRYLLGGGLWNVPAVAFAVGFAGLVLSELVLRALQTSGALPAALPFDVRAMVGFAGWWVAAMHWDVDRAQAPGYRAGGLSVQLRLALLVLALLAPLAILAFGYVRGSTVDPVVVGVSIAAVVIPVAWRGVVLSRTGQEWRAATFLVAATLLVVMAAGGLSVLGQQAHERRVATDQLFETLVEVEQLDNAATRAMVFGADVPTVVAEWRGQTQRIYDRVAASGATPGSDLDQTRIRSILDSYVNATERFWAGMDSNSPLAAAGSLRSALLAHQRLERVLFDEVAAERAAAATWTRRTRLATVIAFGLTLLIVSVLLLRFSAVNRQVELEHLAAHDPLTGLPSRLALEQRLRTPARVDPDDRQALVLLDLDDFKVVNDSLGHPVGNVVLCTVAERLAAIRHRGEFLARVDGDAFALLLEGPRIAEAAVATAERIAAIFEEPIDLDGTPHRISASIGIVIDDDPEALAATSEDVPEDRATVLLRNAEVAMYEAKRTPGFSVEVFAPAMHEAVRTQIELTNELRQAIDDDGLHLVYQPIVDLHSGRVLGYEALVRWQHPTRGPLSPAEFVPLAERTGLIVELGGWVLREACGQLAAWQHRWPSERYVSVNVAGAQLQSGALTGQVRAALDDSGLTPTQLLLEITESSLIEDVDASERLMASVRRLGVRWALDDFGTGYSSLSYLRRFPVQVLKIDKSFIDDVVDADSGGPLVASIINMASSLRMRVVAEGIEHDEQASVLRQIGCDFGQGFRFSRPLPADEVLAFRAESEPAAATPLRVIPQRRAS